MKRERAYFLKILLGKILLGRALPLLLLLSVAGCGFFKEHLLPEPGPEETAPSVIRTRTMLRREGRDSISIKSIDELPPSLLEFKWVVPPGRHRLEVEVELYEDSNMVRDRTYVTKIRKMLDMTTKPGTDYVVDAKKVDGQIYIWGAQINDGQVVAGQAPHGNTLPGYDRGLER